MADSATVAGDWVASAKQALERVKEEGSLEPLYVALRDSKVMQRSVAYLHSALRAMGLDEPYPSEEQLLATLAIMVLTLALYYLFFGKRHLQRRKVLASRLAEAERKVLELARQIDDLDSDDEEDVRHKKPIRVFMDGAFDMMHYGHMNAFRQGRALGTYLLVGINSDASIAECKGTAPVMNDEERCSAVKACKWVDEIITEVPYVMTQEYLDNLIKEHNIDIIVHGDDPCIVDGKDVYANAKAKGLYRSIQRTEGVSTTDIVGRMLYLSRDHHARAATDLKSDLVSRERKRSNSMSSVVSEGSTDSKEGHFFRPSRFLTTSRMLRIFSAGTKDPPPGAKVVYIDGAWDMFHQGHISTLEKARALGDYLIVGVHGDNVVNKNRGKNYPIMNLNERLLSVLGCRYVNDVLIDAPWHITREMIASLGITYVCCGSVSDHDYEIGSTAENYTVPREMNILKPIESHSKLTVQEIVDRILNNETTFQKKVNKKMKAEGEYYSKRYGFKVSEDDKAQ
mmetsp:Transcript_12087/g.22403  ORF Transcript_12087/g.22403 Transcript_12087/m.22403 type:complete len:512 (+) Transcript_12087:188-1723(+)